MASHPSAPLPPLSHPLFMRECDFRAGAATFESMPPVELPEVAFAGRSNVGKSSLINALLGRKSLARVSQNPGCTSQINFYNLSGQLMLVDLPGYGYAKKSKGTLAGWDVLIKSYLKGRPNLARVCLLVDARRGVKEVDLEIMTLLDEAAVIYQVVLTKIDQIPPAEQATLIQRVEAWGKKHVALHPVVHLTSSTSRLGLRAVQDELAFFARSPKEGPSHA